MRKLIVLVVMVVFMVVTVPNKSEAVLFLVPPVVYTAPVWVPTLVEIGVGVVSTVTTIFVAKKIAKDVAEATIIKRTAVRTVSRKRKDGLPDARFNRTEAQRAADLAKGDQSQ